MIINFVSCTIRSLTHWLHFKATRITTTYSNILRSPPFAYIHEHALCLLNLKMIPLQIAAEGLVAQAVAHILSSSLFIVQGRIRAEEFYADTVRASDLNAV